MEQHPAGHLTSLPCVDPEGLEQREVLSWPPAKPEDSRKAVSIGVIIGSECGQLGPANQAWFNLQNPVTYVSFGSACSIRKATFPLMLALALPAVSERRLTSFPSPPHPSSVLW